MQYETVHLDAESECKVSEYFSSMQSQPALLYTALLESYQDGYLVGSRLSHRLCLQKMNQDIAIVSVIIGMATVDVMVLEEATTLFDRVGVTGMQYDQEGSFRAQNDIFRRNIRTLWWLLHGSLC